MNQVDRHFYTINLFALGYYFLILWNLNIGVSEILFFTDDSKSYWDVTLWLMGGEETAHILRRPILYPIILLSVKSIGGDIGIWLINLIFWVFTINLTFRSVYILTKKYVFAYAAATIVLMNVSLLVISLHALAELTCTFMVSLLVYYFVKNISKRNELSFIHYCVLQLSLLTILKPVFFVPLLLVLFVITPLYYWNKYIHNLRKIWILLLVLLPALIQISIVKLQSGNLAISEIGSQTFTNYLLAAGIEENEKINRMKAIEKAQLFSSAEKRKYIYEHKSSYFQIYLNNLEGNLGGYPDFLTFPSKLKNNPFLWLMTKFNQTLYFVHLLFIFAISVFIITMWKTKKYEDFVPVVAMSVLFAYLVLVTGVSFWQGDRLLLPAIPLWICIYLKIINDFIKGMDYANLRLLR